MAHTAVSRLANGNGNKPSAQFAPVQPKAYSGDLCLLRALVAGDYTTVNKVATAVEKTALASTSGVAGGYLVPTGYSTALMDAWSERGFVRPRATIIEMQSRVSSCPYVNDETAQAAGTSPFFGGINFVWGQAGGTVPETEPTFRSMTLTACDLIGNVVLSNQLIADGGEAGELALMKLFGKAANWYEEYSFFNGMGIDSSQPLGILNAPSAIKVTRNSAGLIGQEDIDAMAGSLLPINWGYAIWAVSPTALRQLVGINGYVANTDPLGVEKGCVGSLLSRPVYATEKLPALGTTGDLTFFDPSAYVVGHRQDVIIEASSGSPAVFGTNQTMFRVWLRTAGLPMFANSITLADGTTKASPFVLLN